MQTGFLPSIIQQKRENDNNAAGEGGARGGQLQRRQGDRKQTAGLLCVAIPGGMCYNEINPADAAGKRETADNRIRR